MRCSVEWPTCCARNKINRPPVLVLRQSAYAINHEAPVAFGWYWPTQYGMTVDHLEQKAT